MGCFLPVYIKRGALNVATSSTAKRKGFEGDDVDSRSIFRLALVFNHNTLAQPSASKKMDITTKYRAQQCRNQTNKPYFTAAPEVESRRNFNQELLLCALHASAVSYLIVIMEEERTDVSYDDSSVKPMSASLMRARIATKTSSGSTKTSPLC